MRAARIINHKQPLEIQNFATPEPGPNDAIIRLEACGVCRSDWHAWQGDWSWIGLSPELPITPGHEIGGVVVEVGKDVKSFQREDRVTTPFHSGCGRCEYCLKGRPNLCENLRIYGLATGFDGGYAEYMVIPNADFNLIRLPENVDSLSAAALGCRYMTGYNGIVRGNVKPGDWVTIHGAGGVGLSAIQVANAVGAQVIAVDINDEKLELAKEEGAVETVNAKTENVVEAIQEITKGGTHVGIDALGIKDTVLNSVMSIRKGGRHVQVGLTTTEEAGFVSLPVDLMTASEVEFIGSLGNPHPNYHGLLSLVSSGKLNPKRLIEREVRLTDVNDVFNNMTEYQTKGFNIITDFK